MATLAATRREEFPADVNEAVADLRDGLNAGEAPVAVGADAPVEPSEDDLRDLLPSVSRRGFQLGGAAAVFGLAGCWHEPPDTLVPHRQQPEGSVIGKPIRYSSMIRVDGVPASVLVKTKDFRPIKLEGNPDHPGMGGRLSVRGQAALLDCYDPDRLRRGPKVRDESAKVTKRNEAAGFKDASWAELDETVGQILKAGPVGMLMPPMDGPANVAVIEGFTSALHDVRLAAYSPFAQDSLVEARRMAFGDDHAVEPAMTLYRPAHWFVSAPTRWVVERQPLPIPAALPTTVSPHTSASCLLLSQ